MYVSWWNVPFEYGGPEFILLRVSMTVAQTNGGQKLYILVLYARTNGGEAPGESSVEGNVGLHVVHVRVLPLAVGKYRGHGFSAAVEPPGQVLSQDVLYLQ